MAPAPVLLTNLIIGATVYPAPALLRSAFWTDLAPGLTLSLHATIPPIILTLAIPVIPAVGAEDIATRGTSVYPPPLLPIVIN